MSTTPTFPDLFPTGAQVWILNRDEASIMGAKVQDVQVVFKGDPLTLVQATYRVSRFDGETGLYSFKVSASSVYETAEEALVDLQAFLSEVEEVTP